MSAAVRYSTGAEQCCHVKNESAYLPVCLRAGDTTFLSRVSVVHTVITVPINKGPSPVQCRAHYLLFEKVSSCSSEEQP